MTQNYNLNDIQKNVELVDSEALHMYLISKVESGEFDSCFSAFAAYAEENDIDLDNADALKKIISPSLYGILYKEALEKSMLKEKNTSQSINDFFE